MERTSKLLLWLMIIGPLHMGEQLLFGVEELNLFKGPIRNYYEALAPVGTDRATVILITLVVTFFTLLCFAILIGGKPRLAALAIFGLLGANEGHHVVQAVVNGGYDSGLITCIPYSAAGFMLLNALWHEFRAPSEYGKNTSRLVPSAH
jgi:hypothetical protein